MILQCNSCQKSFVVPDNAITAQGRLVQCSACGNKWKQFPIVKTKKIPEEKVYSPPKNIDVKKEKKIKKAKKSKKREINLYTSEYLQKKHGIKMINPSKEKVKTKKNINVDNKFGFYNYIVSLSVFLIFLLGLLNHTKEIIIINFPFLETYIIYLYDSLNYLKIIFFDIFKNY